MGSIMFSQKSPCFTSWKGKDPWRSSKWSIHPARCRNGFVSMSKWRRELSCNVQPTWNDICVKQPVPFSTEPRAQLKIVGWLWDTRDPRCFYIFCSTSPLHQTCFQTVLFKHFHPHTYTHLHRAAHGQFFAVYWFAAAIGLCVKWFAGELAWVARCVCLCYSMMMRVYAYLYAVYHQACLLEHHLGSNQCTWAKIYLINMESKWKWWKTDINVECVLKWEYFPLVSERLNVSVGMLSRQVNPIHIYNSRPLLGKYIALTCVTVTLLIRVLKTPVLLPFSI